MNVRVRYSAMIYSVTRYNAIHVLFLMRQNHGSINDRMINYRSLRII